MSRLVTIRSPKRESYQAITGPASLLPPSNLGNRAGGWGQLPPRVPGDGGPRRGTLCSELLGQLSAARNRTGQDRKESLPVLGSKEQCPCRNPVGAQEAGKGEPLRLRCPVLSLWKWSQAMPGNMSPLRGSGGDGRRPFSTGSPNLSSDSVWGEPAHLSPRLREESSWHLREGEVCGQPWDFSVTIPRPPSLGHLLLWLLGSGPWEAAHLHQREGPSCLSDLTFSQSSHWCQKLPPPAPSLLGQLRA